MISGERIFCPPKESPRVESTDLCTGERRCGGDARGGQFVGSVPLEAGTLLEPGAEFSRLD